VNVLIAIGTIGSTVVAVVLALRAYRGEQDRKRLDRQAAVELSGDGTRAT
jgi:hypothetical protein